MSLNGVNEIEKALRMLSKANARTFMRLWASVPSGDRQQMIEYLTPLIQDLVAGGSEQAAALALEQLNMQRAGVALPTVLASPSDPDAVAESLRFLLTARGIDVVRDEVWAMIDRHVLNGHRQTMMLSAMAAGNGYARKPEPGACSFCMMLASRGAVYASKAHATSVGAPGVVLRGNKRQGDRYHDNCVIPGTLVTGPASVAGYSRHFEGEVVTLVTSGGREVTVTPNHPVLTDRGWVAAGLVNEGDKLVATVRRDGAVVGRPDEDHVPSAVEDVVGSLGMMGTSLRLRVPGASEQFHGDGFDSEVNVSSCNNLFGDELDAALDELGAEPDLSGTSIPCPLCGSEGASVGKVSLLGGGPDSTPGSFVSGSGEGVTFLGGELGHSDLVGLTASPWLESQVLDPAFDDVATDPVLLRHVKDGFAIGVTTGKVIRDGEFVPRWGHVLGKFDSRLTEGGAEAVGVDAKIGSALIDRLSGSVEFDDIIEKFVGEYSGHVLNLETVEGWYDANDIIVSNCRCQAVEVSEGDGLPPEALELRKVWEKTFYDGDKPILPVTDFESTNEKWKEAVKDFRV